jgi:hypothetical protein
MPERTFFVDSIRGEAHDSGLARGWENIVTLGTHTKRLPTCENAVRSQAYELWICKFLDEHHFTGKTGLRVPEIRAVNPEDNAMYYPTIPGRPLSYNSLVTRPRDVQNDLMRGVGAFAAQLHGLTPLVNETDRQFLRQRTTFPDEYLLRGKQYALELMEFDPPRAETALACADHLMQTEPEEPMLGHGDLCGYNVIAKEDRLTGIIDFANAGLITPTAEARKYAAYGPRHLGSFIEGYSQHGGKDLDPNEVAAWAYVNFAARLVEAHDPNGRFNVPQFGYVFEFTQLRLDYLSETYQLPT